MEDLNWNVCVLSCFFKCLFVINVVIVNGIVSSRLKIKVNILVISDSKVIRNWFIMVFLSNKVILFWIRLIENE